MSQVKVCEQRHTHETKYTSYMSERKYIDVCDCGASRERTDRYSSSWHTCLLCTHPYGLEGK